MKRLFFFSNARPSSKVLRSFLFKPVNFQLVVETGNPVQPKQRVRKEKPIWQGRKSGQIWIAVPKIIEGKKRPKEIFIWAPLTYQANVACMAQIKHLSNHRNEGKDSIEKVLKIKKGDYVTQ